MLSYIKHPSKLLQPQSLQNRLCGINTGRSIHSKAQEVSSIHPVSSQIVKNQEKNPKTPYAIQKNVDINSLIQPVVNNVNFDDSSLKKTQNGSGESFQKPSIHGIMNIKLAH